MDDRQESSTKRPTILITNDDGVDAPGLLALKQALTPLGDVWVLAPEKNQSAVSHKKIMYKPLRIKKVTLADGSVGYMCNGTPTDCVGLALRGVFQHQEGVDVTPDIVVSGINDGYNLDIDVTYSGTVGGAMEAAILGVPGIAISAAYAHVTSPELTGSEIGEVRTYAAGVARYMTEQVLIHGLPDRTFININVPNVAPEKRKGLKLVHLGGRAYPDDIDARRDPSGRLYYWTGAGSPTSTPTPTNDVGAIEEGYVSVTPLTVDMTDYVLLERMNQWGIGDLVGR